MSIDELIEQGELAKNKCLCRGYAGQYISGKEYEHWLMLGTRFLQQNFPDDPQTSRFIQVAERANGQLTDQFDTLVGILKAFRDIPAVNHSTDINQILESIFKNFHRCTRTLLNRHNKRPTIVIEDEYDVQDLLHGILRLFVDDVRPEDYTPSYAGKNTRTDFHLPQYKMYIETKMTRDSLKDSEVGSELIEDIARYSKMCSTLVCFIYDPKNLLSNPIGLKNDLEKLSTDDLIVKVFIAPM